MSVFNRCVDEKQNERGRRFFVEWELFKSLEKNTENERLCNTMDLTKLIFVILIISEVFPHVHSLSDCHIHENEILCNPSEFSHYISSSINTSLFTSHSTLHLTNCYYSGLLRDNIKTLIIDEYYTYETFPLPFISSFTLENLVIEHTNLNQFPSWLCTHNKNLSSIEVIFSHLERILEHDLDLCLNLHTLRLSHSNLKQFTNIHSTLPSVYYLDLNHNQLNTISTENGLNLNQFPHLRTLDLSYNQIQQISSENFRQTSSLTSLDLCFNHLSFLQLDHEEDFLNLEIVDFKGNDHLQIHRNWSNYFPRLMKIYFPYAHFCCNYKHHVKIFNDKTRKIFSDENTKDIPFLPVSFHSNQICFPLPDSMTPCGSLFSSKHTRFLFLLIVTVSVMSNLTALIITISRLSTSTDNRCFSSTLFGSNLALADFISTIYLILVVIIDSRFDENLYTKNQSWPNASLCTLAGFIYIFGIQSSIYALTLLTFERFYTILFSFKRQTPWPSKLTLTIIFIGWLISLLIASLPLINVNNFHSNSLCVPFRLETIFDRLYLSLLILFDLCFIGIIITCNGLICFTFSKSHVHTINDARATLKILTLVIAICVSRIPLIIFLFLTLIIHPTYTDDISNYGMHFNNIKLAILFIQPFSSCFNPFMYSSLLTLKWTKTASDFKLPNSERNSMKLTRFRSKPVRFHRGYHPLRMMSMTSLDYRLPSSPDTP